MNHVVYPAPGRVVRRLELGQRTVLVLVVSEGHDGDEPHGNEEIGNRPMVAGRRADRLARLAGDVSRCRDDHDTGELLASASSLKTAVVPQAPEKLILAGLAEEAVVSLVPGQVVSATAPVQSIVPEIATESVVRAESVDEIVASAAHDHVSLTGAGKDIGPARPHDRGLESEARRPAGGVRGWDARRWGDRQESDEYGE